MNQYGFVCPHITKEQEELAWQLRSDISHKTLVWAKDGTIAIITQERIKQKQAQISIFLIIANVSDFGRLTLLQVSGKTACLSRSSEIL